MISSKSFFIFLAAALFLVTAAGLIYLFAGSAENAPWVVFAYVVGLSMIVLPCTLPLAFVIVPLSMGKGYHKGLLIAAFFGLGVTITLGLYGAVVALLGQAIGLDRAKDAMYAVAGAAAVVFGLSEIGLWRIKIPAYSGKVPDFIQNRGDYLKSFFLGLFLGNVGFGCPNPAFYVLLGYIATVGSVKTGWFLTTIHALGRVTPLLFLAVLGILGVNALPKLVGGREKIVKAMGWTLVFIGAFIFTIGAFGHDWYVYSGIHSFLEAATQEEFLIAILGEKFRTVVHAHEMPAGGALALGQAIFLLLLILPVVWNYFKKKAETLASPDEVSLAVLPWRKRNAVLVVLVIVLIFGYYLPDRFRDSVIEHRMEEGLTDVHDDLSFLIPAAFAHTGENLIDHSEEEAAEQSSFWRDFLVSWQGKLLVSLAIIGLLMIVTFKLLTPFK